jgi:release factor glutamine methyltransferase
MARIYDVYSKALAEGKSWGVLSADIRLLIAHDEGFPKPIDVLFHKDEEMRREDLFRLQFDRLRKGEPVEYIINEATFLEYRLYVDRRVLIPRPETEELVAALTERIDDYYDPRNYLVCADVGTGSGAIAIALKSFFPKWVLVASDVSQDALDVAQINFQKTSVRVQTLLGPSLQPYIDNKINLDIIVCNPPYILKKEDAQPSVRDYEPASALWLEKPHSVYEDIFLNYKRVKKGALLMAFEISPDLVDWLKDLIRKELTDVECVFLKDLSDQIRFLFVYCR